MTYKQIETSREIRLWVTQIIIPAAIVTGLYFSDPQNRARAKERFTKVKNKIWRKHEKTKD